MAKIQWNKVLYDEFCELAMLNEDEKFILETRIKGWTITQQCEELRMSRTSVCRMIADLKKRYDSVQPYSKTLPIRKHSKQEDYMDNN